MSVDITFHTPFDPPVPPTEEEAIAFLKSWAAHDEISDTALMLVSEHARVLGLARDNRGYIKPIDNETAEESEARFAPYKPLYDKIVTAYNNWRAKEAIRAEKTSERCWHCGRDY